MTESERSKIEQQARQRAACLGDDLEIDAGAAMSVSDDGTWVAAWVWVPYEDER